jgi:hypothetical protein
MAVLVASGRELFIVAKPDFEKEAYRASGLSDA